METSYLIFPIALLLVTYFLFVKQEVKLCPVDKLHLYYLTCLAVRVNRSHLRLLQRHNRGFSFYG